MRISRVKEVSIVFILVLCISLLGCQVEKNTIKSIPEDTNSESSDINNKVEEMDNSEDVIKGNSDEDIKSSIEKIQKVKLQGETFVSGLRNPHSVCFDNIGNMYVADGSTLKRISSNKEIEIFASFDERCMTAMVDDSNNIYAVTEHRLYKITIDGEILLLAEGFVRADGLEIDAQSNIYVSDAFANIIYKITPSNEKTVFIDNDLSNIQSNTYYVTGLSFDSDYSNLYTVNHSDSKIMVYPIDSNGTAKEGRVFYDLASYNGPDYIVIDEEWNLYVTVFYDSKLLRIMPDLTLEEIEIDGARLAKPTGLAFGKDKFVEKSLYIANFNFKRVVQVNIGIGQQKR